MIRVLIVEDSPGVRYLLEEFLKALEGVELLPAANAAEAFEVLSMNSPADDATSVDLILMDIRMPEMSGIEACKIIKANEFVGDVPIIMVTAHDDEEHLSNAFNAGAMDYITKPVNRVELLSRVRSALELKREMDSRKRAYVELEKTLSELQDALANVKILKGLLPICSSCKMIRDDQGYWDLLEAFISENSEATFTHGVCPNCIKVLYSDQYEKVIATMIEAGDPAAGHQSSYKSFS